MVHVQSPGISSGLSLRFTLIAGRIYQTLPNQNTESGDICQPPFSWDLSLADLQ